MNPGSLKDAKKIYSAVCKKAKAKNTQVVVCLPFVFLGHIKGNNLGAQNMHFEENGAFTGEISAEMLLDFGVKYVIIGHSERRKYFGETNSDINKKIIMALKSGLTPVLCVGETKQEFDEHRKPEILETQIAEALKDITREQVKNIVIAYEPVWAIGTGQNCSVDETMTSIVFIRKIISELYNREIADNIPMLYGGSVKSFNSREYVKNAGANGLLVGGASLDAEEFVKIVKAVE